MKRKHEIMCNNEREMNRWADSLIEQGYTVERHSGVLPFHPICIPTYKVVFWE